MRRIVQKHPRGCGVACVAMVAGISYAEAFLLFEDKVRYKIAAGKRGTSTTDLRRALAKVGITIPARRRPTRVATRGILAINVNPKTKNWHWVVFTGKRLLDPSSKPATHITVAGVLELP